MMPRFDEAAEQAHREAFVVARGGTSAHKRQLRSSIRCSCLAFREAFADSILNYTHTTEWVHSWNVRRSHCTVDVRRGQLGALDRWWRWLIQRRVLDDNVLEYVPCIRLARDTAPCLTLRQNLQRNIVDYLESRADLAAHTREDYGSWLNRFNVFLNRLPEVPGAQNAKLEIGEEVLASWFRSVRAGRPRETVLRAAIPLSSFIDFLVSRGVLVDNALKRLEQSFPIGKRAGVVYALAAEDRAKALHAFARQPTFRSYFADHLAGFLDLKRAVGCTERYAMWILRDFDRFLVSHGEGGPITNALLAAWSGSRPDLRSSTRRVRWIVIRQFCRYVRRYLPESCVPDSLLGRLPPSQFRPRIVQPGEMRALLSAVATIVPGSRSPLRPHTYRTLLLLLYTTGLRIGEALRIQVGDVDLHERVITIRRTKFYKSRLVPFADGLLSVLRDYHRQRLQLLGAPACTAPFFPTLGAGHYSQRAVHEVWQKLVRHTGLRGDAGRGPRVHDLRHNTESPIIRRASKDLRIFGVNRKY